MLSSERFMVPEMVLQVVRCGTFSEGSKRRGIEPEREGRHRAQDHQDHLENVPQAGDPTLWMSSLTHWRSKTISTKKLGTENAAHAHYMMLLEWAAPQYVD